MAGHAHGGRVRLGAGIAVGLAGIGGSVVGSAVNRNLDGDLLLVGFGVLVLVAAWRMLTGSPSCTQADEDLPRAPSEGVGLLTRRRLDVATVLKVAPSTPPPPWPLGWAPAALTGSWPFPSPSPPSAASSPATGSLTGSMPTPSYAGLRRHLWCSRWS
jgi:uncharacterized membrane protein YfcA